MAEFTIPLMDAATPVDTEGAKFGAARIRETRTKLNEVIGALNGYTPSTGGGGTVASGIFRQVITATTTITIPAGVTSILVEKCIGGGGGAGTALMDGAGTTWGNESFVIKQDAAFDGECIEYQTLTVVPSEALVINIGAGGIGGTLSAVNARPATVTAAASAGGNTTITRASSGAVLFTAKGGTGGDSYAVIEVILAGPGAPTIVAAAGAKTAGGFNVGYSSDLSGVDGRRGQAGRNTVLANPVDIDAGGSDDTWSTVSANGSNGIPGVVIISYVLP